MKTYKTDAEIARSANKLPIAEVAAKLGTPERDIIPYGHDKAKQPRGGFGCHAGIESSRGVGRACNCLAGEDSGGAGGRLGRI